MKYLMLTSFVFMILGCSERSTERVNRTALLKLVDQKIFKLDAETSSYNPQYQIIGEGSNRSLTFFNKRNNSMYFYDYNTQELLKKISFEAEGPNGTGQRVRAFYYHNSDSIFLHSYMNRQFLLFNDKGDLLNKYSLKSEIPRTEMPITGHLTPFFFHDNKLFINNGNKCNGGSGFESPLTVIKLDITDGSIEYQMEYPKDVYYNENGWPGSLCNLYNTFNPHNGEFAYGFAMSPEVIFTDHKQSLEEIDFSSSIVDQRKFKPTYINVSHPSDNLRASSKFAQYGALYFDPYRNYYLRFANSPVPKSRLERNNFKPNQNILIKDINGVTLGEVINFPGSHWFLFTQEGVNQITKDDENEDVLILKVYEYYFD